MGGGPTGPGSTTGLFFTASIGSDPATKMFLALPAYLICSFWRSKSRSSVGSRRGSVAFTNLPDAVRRIAGFGPFAEATCWPVAGAGGADDD